MNVAELCRVLAGRRFAVLTGAGCSTDSGIPDYRGPSGALKKRRPVQYLEFIRDAAARQRYWARSAVGWRRFAAARPNAAHHAVAALERAGHSCGVITQNVDGLHGVAGSTRQVELHGSLHRVMCMQCGARTCRSAFQKRLLDDNPKAAETNAEFAPDGDAELAPEQVRDFRVPPCTRCGGVLKPDVVFFGENVPPVVVASAWEVLRDAEALLVAGSSLFVYSGYRFVVAASERDLPIAVVNRGPTRADALASVKLDDGAGEVLSALAAACGKQTATSGVDPVYAAGRS